MTKKNGNNPTGSTPANGTPQYDQQQGYGSFDPNAQNGYPGGPHNGQGGAQAFPQGQPHPGYQQQWQQPAPPKKNFFLRHKILTGVLALCVVGGIATAAGGGKKNDTASGASASSSGAKGDTKSTDSTKSNDKTSAPKPAALPAVGTPVRDGKFEFTVTKVERNVAGVGDQYVGQKAQGAYTLVHVTVKNISTDTQTMVADGQKAYDAKGIGYEADSTASLYVKDNDTFFKDINPGNTLQGVLVFDAPKGTTLTKVRLHDSMFSNGVEAAL